MQISELLTPVYDAAWLPWAVQYFFLIGIAATTALTAVFAAFGEAGSPLRRLLPAAATVLLVSAVAAPVSLLADLHQPGRFWHFYAHITPWSWMWLGALLLPVFVGLSVLFCAAWWWGRIVWLRVLGVGLALSAASILIYTGAEVMVLRSRPLWHTAKHGAPAQYRARWPTTCRPRSRFSTCLSALMISTFRQRRPATRCSFDLRMARRSKCPATGRPASGWRILPWQAKR